MANIVISTMDSHPIPRGINYRFEYLVHAVMIQVVLKIGPIWLPFMVCFLFNLENIRVEKQQTVGNCPPQLCGGQNQLHAVT